MNMGSSPASQKGSFQSPFPAPLSGCCRVEMLSYSPFPVTIWNRKAVNMETETKNPGNANGTYRRVAPAEVAWMVKEIRTHFGLKQLALAQDACVTERTIERIEAGIAVSDDTLRK